MHVRSGPQSGFGSRIEDEKHQPSSTRTRTVLMMTTEDASTTSMPSNAKGSFYRGGLSRWVMGPAALVSSFVGASHGAVETDVKRRNEAYLGDGALRKAEVNVQSDDFWYPPFLIGDWNTSLSFESAKFVDNIPVDELASKGALPGFQKYSVFFLPDMGRSVEGVLMQFVQLDGHPRGDHPHNLRSLVEAFSPGTKILSAPYSFQKAPSWLQTPSNSWQIEYRDQVGQGLVDLLTQKRSVKIFAGTVETAEFIRQTHWRTDFSDAAERFDKSEIMRSKPAVTDYCLNWRLTVPASLKDEFVTVEDLRRTPVVLGALDVYVYLQPSNNLYIKRPGRPAGVFTYSVVMRRSDGFDESAATRLTAQTEFPFVWRNQGAIELDNYFQK